MAKKLGKALLFTAVASAAAGAALYLLKKKETPVPSEEAEDEEADLTTDSEKNLTESLKAFVKNNSRLFG